MSLGFGFMNGGRGSSEQENAQFQVYSTGIFSGEGVVPSSGLAVSLTGSSSAPQVFVGANPSGYKYTLDESEAQTFTITVPTSNSRVAAIVAAASGTSITGDTPEARNPDECEWFVVYGAAGAAPTAPDDSTIRSSITAQTTKGLNGATAIVAVVCNVTVDSSTTTITAPMISNITSNINLADGAVLPRNLSSDFGYSLTEKDTGKKWIDGRTIYKKVVDFSSSNATPGTAHGIAGVDFFTSFEALLISTLGNGQFEHADRMTTSASRDFILDRTNIRWATVLGTFYDKKYLIAEYVKL